MAGETTEDGKVGEEVSGAPQTSIECTTTISAAISSVSGTPHASPGTTNATIKPVEMGLPPTPVTRRPEMTNEETMDNGYDSDGQLGPFLENGVSDESNYCMDEVPLVRNIDSTVPTENTENTKNDKNSSVPEAVAALNDAAIDKMKVAELRKELEMRGLSKNGNKSVLVSRLKEGVSKNVPLLTDRPTDEMVNTADDGFEPGAYWRLLEADGPPLDESIMEVDGVSFRPPTTTEEEHNAECNERPKKRNFNEIFERESFVTNHLLPERIKKGKSKGKLKKNQVGNYFYIQQESNKTNPNLKYLFDKGIGFHSHPADWFDIFFPQKRTRRTHPSAVTIHDLTSWTNTKAMKMNAGVGGGIYKNFVNFSTEEITSHLGLYLLQSISPSPQIEMKFKSTKEDPVNGSDLCVDVFGSNATTRHKEFKVFFSATNPLIPTPPTTTHPNWKIDPVLKHMMRVSKEAMILGKSISIDEQDIGFQGQHKDKQRISYKRVGDGFLVDALCADGYTFSWYFRNQAAPKMWTSKGLSPLHSRVMSLLQQLPKSTAFYSCGMDNLYISPKFAKICYNKSGRRVMIHGVCRPSRGIPQCIVQEKVTRKADILRSKGTVKAAVLENDSKCKGLIALSFYDSKPVYFISKACETIQWIKKSRKLYHKDKGEKVNVPFYRLNIVDDYNYGMGNVDQADQLRLQYRIHYWIRNRKWWWAIFLWTYECSLTNAYILYRKFYSMHDRKPPCTHYQFVKEVALAWLKPSVYWYNSAKKSDLQSRVSSSNGSTISESIASNIVSRKRQMKYIDRKNNTVSAKSLDPYQGALRCRLDVTLSHLPVKNEKAENSCQLHYWLAKSKYRAQLLRCPTCNVTLCVDCYKHFHETPIIRGCKNRIIKKKK